MKILYLINGLGFSTNTGIGGSDKRAIETIRNLKDLNPQNSYDILTTDSGYQLFKNHEQLETKYYVIEQPRWWPKFLNKYLAGRVLSYFYTTLASIFKYKNLGEYDAYFATSDFFFDVLPAYYFKKKYKKKLICMIHHYIVSPKERAGSLIINTLMYFSQQLSIKFIKMSADILFLYETDEGKKIYEKYFAESNIKIFYVQNGIDDKLIDSAIQREKIYEACFLGALRHSKGIEEFTNIWKLVVEKFPPAKFLVIGGGSQEIVDELQKDIKQSGLENNIILKGPMSGVPMFEEIKKSKLFLFPSHEEGWGIALCEAMYCELPVICYNLPAFKVFGESIISVEKEDYQRLAEKIVYFLSHEEEITTLGKRAKYTAENYTWSNISLRESVILNSLD